MTQETLPGTEHIEDPEPMTVYAVATNYADDPHPHIEAIYTERAPAEEHKKEITNEHFGPVAWCVIETKLQDELNRDADTETHLERG